MPLREPVLDGPEPAEITTLLGAARHGDSEAAERLFRRVYSDLKRIAHRQLGGFSRRETLETTALVHETYLKLARPALGDFHDRVHFLAVASRAMRQILLDRVRARQAAKRGGGATPLELEKHEPAAPAAGLELEAVEQALGELEGLDPRLGRVVEMRFYGGMTYEEIGAALGLSDRTAKSDWRKARAFLESRLSSAGLGAAGA